MRGSYIIAAHYFQRIVQKPLLILFLLAIPFTLLLAEFAAFGRPDPLNSMAPVGVYLTSDNALSETAQRFARCLAEQPGYPLQLLPVNAGTIVPRGAAMVTLSGSLPVSVKIAMAQNDATKYLLVASIAKICAAQGRAASANLNTVAVERAMPAENGASLKRGVFFARFFPGLALFGALFLSQSMASLIWRDQERTIQQRLLTMPVRAAALVAGPLLFLTVGGLAVLALLLGGCALATNPPVLLSPALWTIVVGFAVCAAGLQLTLGLLTRSHLAVQAISASAIMLLAFFGGGFVPLSLYPPVLRAVAYALPNGASQAGLTQILEGTGQPISLLWFAATVWLWAALLAGTAIALQIRRMHS